MAGMKSIDEALTPLEETTMRLDLLVKSYTDLAGDEPPPWLYLFQVFVSDLVIQVDGYSTAVHENARPVLNDLAKLTR